MQPNFNAWNSGNFGNIGKNWVNSTLHNSCNFNELYNFFPYTTFDCNNQVFSGDNRIGFVLETVPIVQPEDDFAIATVIEQELQGLLPEQGSIQVILFADPHIGDFLGCLKNAPNSSIMKAIANSSVANLKRTAATVGGGRYVLRNFRVFICVSQITSYNCNAIAKLNQLKNKMAQQLHNIGGLPPIVWNADNLLTTITRIINIDPEDSRGFCASYDNLHEVNRQLQEIGLRFLGTNGCEHLHLPFSKLKVKAYHADHAPDEVRSKIVKSVMLASYADFNQISCPFMVSYKINRTNSYQKINPRLSVLLFAESERDLLQYAKQLLVQLGIDSRMQLNGSEQVQLTGFIDAMPLAMANVA